MQKFRMMCLGAVLLTLGSAKARIDGPYPTLYTPQTIASYPLTSQQVPYIRQAFNLPFTHK